MGSSFKVVRTVSFDVLDDEGRSLIVMVHGDDAAVEAGAAKPTGFPTGKQVYTLHNRAVRYVRSGTDRKQLIADAASELRELADLIEREL